MSDLTKQSELKELALKIDALRKRRDDMLRSDNWVQDNQDEYILELDSQWPTISNALRSPASAGVREADVIEVEGFEGTPDALADHLSLLDRALANAALFLNLGAGFAPDTAINEKFCNGERLKTRGLASVMREIAKTCSALSDHGVQESAGVADDLDARLEAIADECTMEGFVAGEDGLHDAQDRIKERIRIFLADELSIALLSKTLTEGEKKSIATKQSTDATSAPVPSPALRAYQALFEPPEGDAYDNLTGALYDIKRHIEAGESADDVCVRTIERVLDQLNTAYTALAPANERSSLRLTLDYVRLGVKAGLLMAVADCGNHSESCMEGAMTDAGLSKRDKDNLNAQCDAADAIRKRISETCEDSALGYAAYMLSEEDQAALAVLGVTSDWLYRKTTGEPSRKELLDPVAPRAVANTHAAVPGDTSLVSGASSEQTSPEHSDEG